MFFGQVAMSDEKVLRLEDIIQDYMNILIQKNKYDPELVAYITEAIKDLRRYSPERADRWEKALNDTIAAILKKEERYEELLAKAREAGRTIDILKAMWPKKPDFLTRLSNMIQAASPLFILAILGLFLLGGRR